MTNQATIEAAAKERLVEHWLKRTVLQRESLERMADEAMEAFRAAPSEPSDELPTYKGRSVVIVEVPFPGSGTFAIHAANDPFVRVVFREWRRGHRHDASGDTWMSHEDALAFLRECAAQQAADEPPPLTDKLTIENQHAVTIDATKTTLELPDGDPRTARIAYQSIENGSLHLCLVVEPEAASAGDDDYWWCRRCESRKHPNRVTFEETCADCGCGVELRSESPSASPPSPAPAAPQAEPTTEAR